MNSNPKPYIRGNNKNRKRRHEMIRARDSVDGVLRCRFCTRKLPEQFNAVRIDLSKRFDLDNCVAACDTCTRTPAIRSLTA